MCSILLVIWTIYTYRDIWPLATYTLVPVDASEGWILWVKISSLTLAGVMKSCERLCAKIIWTEDARMRGAEDEVPLFADLEE